MKNKEYREAHKVLEPEFALARAVIRARAMAALTQEQLAERMATATGTRLRITFERCSYSIVTADRFSAARACGLSLRRTSS
jgi:hypothetical protein